MLFTDCSSRGVVNLTMIWHYAREYVHHMYKEIWRGLIMFCSHQTILKSRKTTEPVRTERENLPPKTQPGISLNLKVCSCLKSNHVVCHSDSQAGEKTDFKLLILFFHVKLLSPGLFIIWSNKTTKGLCSWNIYHSICLSDQLLYKSYNILLSSNLCFLTDSSSHSLNSTLSSQA